MRCGMGNLNFKGKIVGNVKFIDSLSFFHNDLTDFTG